MTELLVLVIDADQVNAPVKYEVPSSRRRIGWHGDREPATIADMAVSETSDPEATPERFSAAAQHPDMWVDPEDDPRSEGGGSSDERSVLLEYLQDYRLTLQMKCDGLDAEQLARRSVPPSTLSLLGLLRHMAKVEHSWFRRVMEGVDVPRLYWSEDDRDKDFNEAVADPAVVEDAWATLKSEITNAERFVDEADDLGMMDPKDEISLREVLVHMIEEYARHCGHADFLRERIDGRVGQ